MLSAVIITKNEQDRIADCLDSVQFCDEIVVLDGGSNDHTVAIAKARGATVSVNIDWQGFGIQKNRAIDLATNDWVLVVDADERISNELAREIVNAIAHREADSAYSIKRITPFYGQTIRFGGFEPEQGSVRLFRKSKFRFDGALVHEKVDLKGARAGRLVQPITHLSYEDPNAYLSKLMLYSKLAAEAMFARGKRASALAPSVHGFAALIKAYFFKAGFLDGRGGWVLAVYQAEMTYHKYFRLWLLSKALAQ